MKKYILAFLIILAFAVNVFSATYYIDYTTGADSNNGTAKATPWKRHPYMAGFAGSYTHAAGDVFIFKGGVTWAYNGIYVPSTSGGSGYSTGDIVAINQNGASGGQMTVAGTNISIVAKGNNYTVGDILTVGNGQVKVTAVYTGGATTNGVSAIAVVVVGSGLTTQTYSATGGTGTGCTISVNATYSSALGFVSYLSYHASGSGYTAGTGLTTTVVSTLGMTGTGLAVNIGAANPTGSVVGDQLYNTVITHGGSVGNVDTYTSDPTWYVGGSFTLPILDGGQQAEGSTVTLGISSALITDYTNKVGYIKIDSIQLQNIGYPLYAGGGDGSGMLIRFMGSGSNIEISNCILYPHSVEAFGIDNYYNVTNQSNILIHNNTINYAGRGVIYGEPGYLVNNVQVYSNHWTGDASLQNALYLGAGWHGDGLMVGCRAGCGTDVRMSNIQFYNNKMDGSWSRCTALYYSDGNTSNTLIYNNIFATENTTATTGSGGNYFIRFNADGNDSGTINILNNTFSSDSLASLGYGLNMSGAVGLGTFASGTSSTITIENNIFSGPEMDVLTTLNGVATLTMDYNLHNPYTGDGRGQWVVVGGVWYTYSMLSALHSAGYENNGHGSSTYASSYPGFVTVPTGAGTGNWMLQSGSPAIDVGVDLSAYFTTDILGNTRQTVWDLGAYDYAADNGGATYTLSVTSLHGTVTSSPAGISCTDNAGAGTCSYNFPSESVTLTASADSGYTFTPGWSGTGVASGCTGTGTCVVTTSAVGAATATYTATPPNPYNITVSMVNAAGGTLSNQGINQVAVNGSLTITATLNVGWQFAWSGTSGCTGHALTCTVSNPASDGTVIGTFTPMYSYGGGTHTGGSRR